MAELFDLDTTASNNTARFPENMQFRTVNDSARELEAMLARHVQDHDGSVTSSGSSNAYTVSPNRTISSLSDKLTQVFTANHSNTGSPTLNLSALGAKSIVGPDGSALIPGDIVSGSVVHVVYSLTNDWWQLISQRAASPTDSGTSLKVGDVVITLDTSPRTGRIRLGESTQTFDPVTYPELSQWLTGLGSPWGANTLPAAAGYFLRFGSTTSTIDTAGPRTAGLIQTDQNKQHNHGGSTGDAGAKTISITTAVRLQGTGTGESYTVPGGSTATSDDHSHSISNDGGDEVRTKNVTMHADIIASASQSNIDVYAVNGRAYTFDDGTSAADPGSGRLRLNNATLASATAMYISETGYFGEDLASWIATWDDSNSAVKGQIHFYKVGAPANFAIYSVTASITDSGTYDTITISHVDSSGSFSNGDPIGVQFARTGQKGDAGPPGGGISYDWDTSTSDADPGSGNIRGDNATLSSVTELYVSTTDSDSADETAWLDSLDDSSSTIKGLLQIVESNTPSNFALFQITSVTTASGYRKLGVTYLTGNGSFSASDGLSLNFSRTGDVGTAGGDGVSAGVSYTFSTDTTTTTDPGTGNLELNNATLASVTEIALDDNSAATGNPDISAWLATLDDSTSTTKGQLFIKKNSAPQNFAIYEIASITDATTHYRVTVTHVDSAGSFSASDALSVQFYPRGDAGSGSVSSVFGRSGAVVAASGDYDDDEVSAAASATNYTPAASTVAGHLSGIDTALGSVGGISDVVDDTTPQLGGQLDVNGQAIGDGTRELLTFVEDGSAVNHVEIENEATGSGPIIRAAGDDANVDLVLAGKGTGVPKIGSNAILDAGDIGSSVQAHDAETVKADTDDNFTAGYTATADNDGTQSSGTYTPDPAGGNLKRIVNGGAFTFAAPTASNDYTMVVDILNNASAGTITTSGFDFEDGASFTTTNGDRFRCFITKINGVIDMYIRAIQ